VTNESGIGVQQILPRAGTRWKGSQHAPERQNDHKGAHDVPPSESAPTPPAPPAPGTGTIVDRTV
jgi:hypothetical protein